MIHDDEICSVQDKSLNFYITDDAIKQKVSRSHACIQQLRELNEFVKVEIHQGELRAQDLLNFNIVVFTDYYDKQQLIEYNEVCRKNNVGFIYSCTLGLYGCVFVDFGDHFKVLDNDGEPPAKSFVSYIEQGKNPLITLDGESKGGFHDGDTVRISDVVGMSEINGQEYKITI